MADQQQAITERDSVIAHKEGTIRQLEDELKRMQDLNSQSGLESSELATKLTATQKALQEAEEKIR